MRELLFRGKRVSDNKWVYGGVLQTEEWSSISVVNDYEGSIYEPPSCDVDDFEVIPSTIGQYTGLKDKNEKRIFEGDIVKAVYKSNYIGVPDTDFGIGVVEYEGTYYDSASYQINIIGEVGNRAFSASLEVEVIGNVTDNPVFEQLEMEVQK